MFTLQNAIKSSNEISGVRDYAQTAHNAKYFMHRRFTLSHLWTLTAIQIRCGARRTMKCVCLQDVCIFVDGGCYWCTFNFCPSVRSALTKRELHAYTQDLHDIEKALEDLISKFRRVKVKAELRSALQFASLRTDEHLHPHDIDYADPARKSTASREHEVSRVHRWRHPR